MFNPHGPISDEEIQVVVVIGFHQQRRQE